MPSNKITISHACVALTLLILWIGCSKKSGATAVVGPGGPPIPNDRVLTELKSFEKRGFIPFDDKAWTEEDRKAMTIVWNKFIEEDKVTSNFPPTSFIPRYKIDHGDPMTITMVWVYFDSNENPLTPVPGGSTFTVQVSSDLKQIKILLGV